MKSQAVIRAAVCAAIVAICIAGAVWFTTHPVAGQETKQQSLQGAAALDQLKQDGQYESLQAAMNQARFGVSRAEATPLGRAAWRAPNPAAGYDAYVTEEGVSIALNNRTYVSLSLHTIGYGHAVRSVAPGEVYADKQTINITREDGLREWYVNGPEGLEHGFTLSEPPGVQSKGAPLRLTLQVSKGWRAVAGEDGQRVILRGGDDQAVEYGKLVVFDSQRRNIPARLAVTDEQVVIEAEDSDATYPLTIDPIITLQHKRLAADGEAFDFFGSALALDGDTLVVGAWNDTIGANWGQGSVYVFTRSGATWTQQQKLIANDGEMDDFFGTTVALDGDTLVVGAESDNIGANQSQGSIYIFTRNGSAWTQQQKLIANDGGAGDCFGGSVALDDETLVVGAYIDNIGANVNQGSAYVFMRSGGIWTQQHKLVANDGAADDYFGNAVALDGDMLVVGARKDDIDANADQGSAYIFTRSGGIWTQQHKLVANDGAAGDWFGWSVALDGDTVVVGAMWNDIGANTDQGSAYVFTRSDSTWTQRQKLIANDGAAGDYFGTAVALDGDMLVVGAMKDVIGANGHQGSAYVFGRSGSTWTQQQKLTANDGETHDDFGAAVALSGHTVIVGAPSDSIGANTRQGSVYFFSHSITISPYWLYPAIYGEPYSATLTASGGVAPYTFRTITSFPKGLNLSADGFLSGTPKAIGTYHVMVEARDAYGCVGVVWVTTTIEPPLYEFTAPSARSDRP